MAADPDGAGASGQPAGRSQEVYIGIARDSTPLRLTDVLNRLMNQARDTDRYPVSATFVPRDDGAWQVSLLAE